MQSNLDKFFKTDKGLEQNGVWFMVSDGVGFLVKRFGGYNSTAMKAAMAKYQKPFIRQIQAGTLPDEKLEEISIKVFVEASLIDWKGVEIDGVVPPFSFDAAVKLLKELPELAATLISYASSLENYKEDLGNY